MPIFDTAASTLIFGIAVGGGIHVGFALAAVSFRKLSFFRKELTKPKVESG
jgi:hypothetical protein